MDERLGYLQADVLFGRGNYAFDVREVRPGDIGKVRGAPPRRSCLTPPRAPPAACARPPAASLVRAFAMSVARPQSTPRFTGMALDRATAQRSDPSWVAHQVGLSDARAVAAGGDSVLVDSAGEALLRVPMPTDGEAILLGLEGGVPVFGVDLEDGGIDGGRVVSLRDAGAMLPQSEGGLAAYVVALLGWHRRHRYCANCGAATEVREAGYSRHCPRCGASHFPRTDPVVIMLVEHDGSLLLGRRPGWPGRRFSVLAGFVAPGESAEEAVVREVREESGVVAYDPRFVASQPWPFPASLMLGFTAHSDGGHPVPRDGELEEVAWFTREEVRAAAAGEGAAGMALPPRVSIARFLIDRWLEPG